MNKHARVTIAFQDGTGFEFEATDILIPGLPRYPCGAYKPTPVTLTVIPRGEITVTTRT